MADVAVSGTDLGTAVRRRALASVVNQVASQLYKGIGDISGSGPGRLNLDEGDLRKVVMHAVVGCGAGAAVDAGCMAGAIGAGLQELGSPILDDLSEDPETRSRLAGLAGATVTMLAGGDAQAIHFANQAGQTARTMNRNCTCKNLLCAN